MIFVTISSAMVVSHSIFLSANRKSMDVRHSEEALVQNMARSGLVEASSWFRRQEHQPVLSFEPQLDSTATPPLFDTVDPDVGLVREFEIAKSLWGRYEIRRDEVVDISLERGISQPGVAWEVGVRAFVYRRNDPSIGFESAPNQILATTAMSTELRGISVQIPVLAAINITDVNRLLLNGADTLIDGGGKPGVSFDDGTAPLLPVDGKVLGNPARTGTTGLDLGERSVFGMSLRELHNYADVIVDPRIARDSRLVAADKLVMSSDQVSEVRGFDLDDSVMVINGDLKLQATSVTDIRGILYVRGSLIVAGQLNLQGALIVTNDIDFAGATQVQFDGAVVDRVIRGMARYRMPRIATPTTADD